MSNYRIEGRSHIHLKKISSYIPVRTAVWGYFKPFLHQQIKELLNPPTIQFREQYSAAICCLTNNYLQWHSGISTKHFCNDISLAFKHLASACLHAVSVYMHIAWR